MARLKSGVARVGKAVLKLAAAYIILYLIVTLYGLIRVEMELARLRSAGEPVTMSDLAPPPLPDSENAALLYAKAFRVNPGDQHGEDSRAADSFLNTWARLHYPQTAEPARKFVRGYQKALDYAQEAALRPKCRFPVDWSKDPFELLFPHNAQLRRLSYVSSVAAILAAKDGRSDEATRLLLSQIRIVDAVKDEPTVLAQMMRQHLLEMASKTLRKVAQYGGMDARDARLLYDAFSAVDIESTFPRCMRAHRASILRIFSELRRHPLQACGVISSLG